MKATTQTPLMTVLLVVVVYAVACSSAADNRISRQRGNILRNLTASHAYVENIVTSPLDASVGIRQVYRTVRDIYNKYV